MKTAVIYARYSSDRQTEQSIEGQLRVCNDYATRNNIAIVDTYVDRAMTGTNDNRKDFQRLLKDSSKKAWDIVLVYKLDRFSRNKYEMAMHKKTLRDNGIKLVSAMENIPDTPEGIILESLLEGMAEYYSAELSQKVRRGMNESRQKGQFTGGLVLYGYKVVNKKLEINEDEANIVRKIFTDFVSGKLVTDILNEFKEKQVLYRGKTFARNTLYNLLKNEKYIGIYRYNEEVFNNIYPAIISKELFEIVRNKIENNKYGKHKADVVYLLKNKLKCGYCNHIINSEAGTSKTGIVFRYYKCTKKKFQKNCECKPIRKELIEELVVNTILSGLSTNDLIYKIANKVVEINNKNMENNSELNIFIKEKASLEKSISNILSAMEQGIITPSTKLYLEQLENKKQLIEEQILFEESKEQLKITIDDIVKYIKDVLTKKSKLMIDLLIKEVKLYNDKIEIYFNFNKFNIDSTNEVVYSEEKSVKTYHQLKESKFNIEVLI